MKYIHIRCRQPSKAHTSTRLSSSIAFALAILLARIFGTGWLRHYLTKIFRIGDHLHRGKSQTTTTSDEIYTTSSSLSSFYQTVEKTMITSDEMFTMPSSLSSLYLTPARGDTEHWCHFDKQLRHWWTTFAATCIVGIWWDRHFWTITSAISTATYSGWDGQLWGVTFTFVSHHRTPNIWGTNHLRQ